MGPPKVQGLAWWSLHVWFLHLWSPWLDTQYKPRLKIDPVRPWMPKCWESKVGTAQVGHRSCIFGLPSLVFHGGASASCPLLCCCLPT